MYIHTYRNLGKLGAKHHPPATPCMQPRTTQ